MSFPWRDAAGNPRKGFWQKQSSPRYGREDDSVLSDVIVAAKFHNFDGVGSIQNQFKTKTAIKS